MHERASATRIYSDVASTREPHEQSPARRTTVFFLLSFCCVQSTSVPLWSSASVTLSTASPTLSRRCCLLAFVFSLLQRLLSQRLNLHSRSSRCPCCTLLEFHSQRKSFGEKRVLIGRTSRLQMAGKATRISNELRFQMYAVVHHGPSSLSSCVTLSLLCEWSLTKVNRHKASKENCSELGGPNGRTFFRILNLQYCA